MRHLLVDFKKAEAPYCSASRISGSNQAHALHGLEASNTSVLVRPSHNPPIVLCVLTSLLRGFSALKAESATCHSFCCPPASAFSRCHSYSHLCGRLFGHALTAISILQSGKPITENVDALCNGCVGHNLEST